MNLKFIYEIISHIRKIRKRFVYDLAIRKEPPEINAPNKTFPDTNIILFLF